MNKTLITLHTVQPAGEDDEYQIDFFSKKPFKPTTGLIGLFEGKYPVSLETALARGFRIADNFDRPAVSTRAELGQWLESRGVTRVKNYNGYMQILSELGRSLDPGHKR
jgi:hypothetical protein